MMCDERRRRLCCIIQCAALVLITAGAVLRIAAYMQTEHTATRNTSETKPRGQTPVSGAAPDHRPAEKPRVAEGERVTRWRHRTASPGAAVRITTVNHLFVESDSMIEAVERLAGTVVWAYRSEKAVLVWARDRRVVFLDGDILKGFDIEEGRLLWTRSADAESRNTYAAAGDLVWSYSSAPRSCLTLLDPATGREVRSLQVASRVLDVTVIGAVFLVSHRDSWSAYSIEDGTERWRMNKGQRGELLVHGRYVILARDRSVSARRLDTGAVLWEHTLVHPVVSLHSAGARVVTTTRMPGLQVYDVQTGTELKRIDAMDQAVCVDDQFIFLSDVADSLDHHRNSVVSALAVSTGHVMWKWTDTCYEEDFSPADVVSDGEYAAVAHVSGRGAIPDPEALSYFTDLSILAAHTGAPILKARFPEGMSIVEHVHGVVYVLTTRGELYAIRTQEARPADFPSSVPQVRAHLDLGVDPAEARVYLDGVPVTSGPEVRLATSFGHHHVRAELGGYLPFSRTVTLDHADPVLLEINLLPSIVALWQAELNLADDRPQRVQALFADGAVTIALTSARISCHDAQTGRFRWATDASTRCKPALVDGMLFFAYERRLIAIRVEDGNILWERRFEAQITWMETNDGLLFLRDSAGGLYTLSRADGAQLWQRQGRTDACRPCVFNGNMSYFVENGRISLADTRTGAVLWTTRSSGFSGTLISFASVVGVYDPAHQILIELDQRSGIPRRTHLGVIGQPACGASYLVYTRRFLKANQRLHLLCAVPIASAPTPPPPIPHRSVGTTEERLVCPRKTMYVLSRGRLRGYDLRRTNSGWEYRLRALDPARPCALEEVGEVVFIGFDRTLIGLDRASGVRVWEWQLKDPVQAMCSHESAVFVTTSRSLIKLSTTGSELG